MADEDGNFDWAEPDEEVHASINDLVRSTGTCLYGRRMYGTMAAWETDATLATRSEVIRDFAQIWQAADKIVYSRRLKEASTARTRIEREFNPEAVRGIKTSARADMTVGGPDFAAQAFRSGLVDEFTSSSMVRTSVAVVDIAHELGVKGVRFEPTTVRS